MNQTTNQKPEKQIKEYKALILEAREEGFNNIADMWAEELEKVLANHELVGNKPRI